MDWEAEAKELVLDHVEVEWPALLAAAMLLETEEEGKSRDQTLLAGNCNISDSLGCIRES